MVDGQDFWSGRVWSMKRFGRRDRDGVVQTRSLIYTAGSTTLSMAHDVATHPKVIPRDTSHQFHFRVKQPKLFGKTTISQNVLQRLMKCMQR